MMDTSYYDDQIIKRCFNMQKNLRSINVVHNTANNLTALWNRFQISLYKNLEFDCNEWYQSDPEFQIYDLIMSSNCSMCLDYTGNVHLVSLKFKGAQKRFHYSFNPREHGVMACSLYNEDYTICLKYELDAYFLSAHKINTEFKLEKRVIIMCNEHLPLQQLRDKYILKAYHITENHIESVKKCFSYEEIVLRNNNHLVVISFDRLSVYACLFSARMTAEEVTLVQLYTCPSKIANIEFVATEDLNIVVGLAIGTLVTLNLSNLSKPQITHLNTAIHKFSITNDTVIYTDGLSMWKGEKILSENIKFTEFFVKNVKDFVNVGDQIICSTFNDFIYILPIDDERSYTKASVVDEYCAAENLLESSKYLQKILDEVKKIETLIKRQSKERNYITALSLSNRQDIMATIITQEVIVYENYEDAVQENTDMVLTNTFSEYFDTDSFYFLIKINTSSDHRFNEILSNNLGDLRLHITITSETKVVKTNTIKVTDLLKKITLLIPLRSKFINATDMMVQIKIMTNMPGALDAKQKIWTILYRETVILNSEHFIKFNFNAQNTSICLKEPKETIQEMIVQTSMNQYSNLIEITEITCGPEIRKWNMYVRLPTKYAEVFENEGTFKKFTSKKENYFLQQFTSDDFLKSKSCLTLSISKEKVFIGIDNDGFSNPSLKISSHNAKTVLDIRNFLSNLINTVFTDLEPGKEYISHSFYITVENLQKSVRECISSSSDEDMLLLIEQFERKVVGLLPI